MESQVRTFFLLFFFVTSESDFTFPLPLAIRHGFNFFSSLGGIEAIQSYTFELIKYLLNKMKQLVHYPFVRSSFKASFPLCVIYSYSDLDKISSNIQGPTITFNLQDPNGEPIGFNEVNRLASQHNIQIRTGKAFLAH
jgi:selenocysteine lyase/cysteine desulfurase